MIRGTTPTFTFNLPFDTSVIKKAYITIRSRGIEVEKSKENCTLNGNTISTTLTQEETLALPKSLKAEVQLRVLTNDNKALATEIYEVEVAEILKEGVIK